jgi:hypothetical protein
MVGSNIPYQVPQIHKKKIPRFPFWVLLLPAMSSEPYKFTNSQGNVCTTYSEGRYYYKNRCDVIRGKR